MKKVFIFPVTLLILTVLISPEINHKAEGSEEAEFRIPDGRTEFSPKLQQIKRGTAVKWINEDKRTHFLTAADPNRKEPAHVVDDLLIHHLMPPGEVFQMQFDKPGNYDFFCAIHMEMRGSVTVTP